jgi:hypothetical protein
VRSYDIALKITEDVAGVTVGRRKGSLFRAETQRERVAVVMSGQQRLEIDA